MERISSRKNRLIVHFKALSADSAYRCEKKEFLCDGEKMLREAISCGASVTSVLWGERPSFPLSEQIMQYTCPFDLLQYASPLKNTPGPLFSVRMRTDMPLDNISSALIMENVQDPGNVGTIIRTANAMGIDIVASVGDCADVYNFKSVRSSMGAIFRQGIISASIAEIRALADNNGLKLYAAAPSETSADIRSVGLKNSAIAIGSEGAGLSDEFLSACDGQIIIPMKECSESLNAAIAAAIVMWEMSKNTAGEGK